MEYNLTRDDDKKTVDCIRVYIGLDRYRLTEVNGCLNITKMSDGDTDAISVHPVVSNEIRIN